LIALAGGEALSLEELRARVTAGARLVRFEYCLSLLFFTLRRQSPMSLTEFRLERYLRGLGYSALALLLGPWGVPWGLILTPWAVWVNLTGGVDETEQLMREFNEGTPLASEPSSPVPGNANANALRSHPDARDAI
jgi:hypothetical protein